MPVHIYVVDHSCKYIASMVGYMGFHVCICIFHESMCMHLIGYSLQSSVSACMCDSMICFVNPLLDVPHIVCTCNGIILMGISSPTECLVF